MHTLYRENEAKSSKKKDRTLFITPNVKFEVVLAVFSFSQISLTPFFQRAFQLHYDAQLSCESLLIIFKGQCGNVAVPDEQPIHVHFPDEEHLFQLHEDDDGQTERVEEELKTGTDEGSSVSRDEGICRSLWQSS